MTGHDMRAARPADPRTFSTMARLAVVLTAVLMLSIGPAGAITNGELDGDGHPHVGIMVASVDGVPSWRCSGTLISPTLFLTAGHCTDGADHVELWFDADVDARRAPDDYPFVGDASGTPHTHPGYDAAAFFLADVGVVVLDEPMEMDTYGELPTLNQLDALKPRRQATFTAVGYGLQRINPAQVQADLVRMVAYPHLVQINGGITGDFSLMLSNNAHTGGTCFGDSGGPNFLGDTDLIAGVTSFGLNGTCGGTGGVFRMDRAVPLEWVESFLAD
jgi:secreted trypsin-like serine protease